MEMLMIHIRFAQKEDIEGIINFLRKHWNGNSILVKSRKIFEYQYCRGDKCHFVIAIDDITNEIYGLKGYIPLNQTETPDIAAALAIVLQGVRPMLGMEIQRFLEKETKCRWLCATGLNPNTSVRVYKLFRNKYTVNKLNHYYRLSDRDEYYVAKVVKKNILPVNIGSAYLKQLKSIDELNTTFDIKSCRNHKPYKDIYYLQYRYFNHPIYHYSVMGIMLPGDSKALGLIFARENECNGTKALRIVDYIGDKEAISIAGSSIQNWMDERNYEYIDFYCYGIPHEILTKAGFVLRDNLDPNIIPNYFEPFVQDNVDIYFFYTGVDPLCTIFKADGDQDRPNLLPEGWIE